MSIALRKTSVGLLVGLCFLFSSQTFFATDHEPVLSEKATISLLTMWPGKEIYIAFGHSAFRVQDPSLGLDEVYNYGTFYLDDPLFVPKFVQGELNYVLGREPFERQFRFDQRYENRTWYQQDLNLDSKEKNKVYAFLVENARPENRTYRYDFVWDNCATRPRDVLVKTLGTAVQFAPGPNLKGLTIRQMLDEYLVNRPLYHFGITLLLGSVIDREASAYESMFLPHYLMWEFDRARINLPDGTFKSLVLKGSTILQRSNEPYLAEKWLDPSFLFWPLVFITGIMLVLQLRKVHLQRQALNKRLFMFRVLDFTWFFVWGLLALITFYVAVPSTHNATKANWTLFWFWPSHVVLAFFLLKKRTGTFVAWYLLVSSVAALVPLLLWWLWPQAMHPAQVPFMLIYAIRGCALWHRWYSPRILARTSRGPALAHQSNKKAP